MYCQRWRWAVPNGGSSQSEISNWLLSCQAPFSEKLRSVNFTDLKTSEKLPHRNEPHRAWILQKWVTVRSLAVFWDCTVTFALLVDFIAFSRSIVRLFLLFNASVCGGLERVLFEQRSHCWRTAGITRRREMTAEKEKKRWVERAVSNIPCVLLRCKLLRSVQVYGAEATSGSLCETQARCCSLKPKMVHWHSMLISPHHERKKEMFFFLFFFFTISIQCAWVIVPR